MANQWFAFYPGDYGRDTGRLSLVDHGAYFLLLSDYYSTGGPLPLNHAELFQICKAFRPEEQAATLKVVRTFFHETPAGWINHRADRELARQGEKMTKRVASGIKGAASKWGSDRENLAKLTRAERLTNARRLASHQPGEWYALLNVLGVKCLKCGAVDDIVKDHITPIYQGGSDGIENLQPLCRKCNAAKGADATDLRPEGWQNAWQNAWQTPDIPQPQPQEHFKDTTKDDPAGKIDGLIRAEIEKRRPFIRAKLGFSDAEIEIELEEILIKCRARSPGPDVWLYLSKWFKNRRDEIDSREKTRQEKAGILGGGNSRRDGSRGKAQGDPLPGADFVDKSDQW